MFEKSAAKIFGAELQLATAHDVKAEKQFIESLASDLRGLKKEIRVYFENLSALQAECISLQIYDIAGLVHAERKRVLRQHPSEFSEEDKQEIMEPKPDSNNENIGKGAAMAGAAVAAAAASFAFTGNNA